ncbi:MAG TPA: MarC family protein [Victivallis vadensis]|nr:MarC family protein [Victivallis vadensis]
MDGKAVFSLAFLLVMLMDPFGNLPVFITLLQHHSGREYSRIIWRESLFALAVMAGALLLGRNIMELLHVSSGSLGVAGGLILLIIGVKMVFSTFREEEAKPEQEPFIVPLAVPLICGPGLIAMLVTLRGGGGGMALREFALALFVAWLAQLAILQAGRPLARLLGAKALNALESLMGLLLAGIAVGMILENIGKAVPG